jgi:hypothetical protein
VSNWFINARVRLWKPLVEEIQSASTHTHAGAGQFLSAYKSEPMSGMDARALSSLGGAAFFRTRSRTTAKTPGSWRTAATWPTSAVACR